MAEQPKNQSAPWAIFDDSHYIEINEARWQAVQPILQDFRALGAKSCNDLGCGPGWFSERLQSLGFDVTGLEARDELVDEARRRIPAAQFVQCNLDWPLPENTLAPADISFCFGLLYHLENPFQAVRNLAQLTRRFCLVESQLTPGDAPSCRLVQETSNINQGFTNFAMIPTKPALVKMLDKAGFTHIYECTLEVKHSDFVETAERLRRRRIFVASFEPLSQPGLEQVQVPETPKFNYNRQ